LGVLLLFDVFSIDLLSVDVFFTIRVFYFDILSVNRLDHLAVVGGILDSIGLAAMIAGLEPAGLHYLARSAGALMPIWSL
jgi:hypothetical protein